MVDAEVVDAALVRELLADEVAHQVALSPDEATVDGVGLAPNCSRSSQWRTFSSTS